MTERITITLPDSVARRLKETARKTRTPVSRLVAEALEQQQAEEFRRLMIEGYKETREESRRTAEEWWPLAGERLPDD